MVPLLLGVDRVGRAMTSSVVSAGSWNNLRAESQDEGDLRLQENC